MTTSSRKPPDWSETCPQCGAAVPLEPSDLFGQTTCSNCGEAVWFLYLEPHLRVYRSATSQHLRSQVIAFIVTELKMDPQKVSDTTITFEDLGTNSLDTIELVMKLEKVLDAA